MGYQAAPDGSFVLPCGLYQFMSNTEAQHCSLSPNGCFTLPLAPHLPYSPPIRPTPIDSIRDITGAEKSYLKNQPAAFK